ncbi:MAG: carbamate kinase [Gammaproteobacteria bacterium]|nr:carbamate kinase [Gammaproteobacteria bacterium]
MRVVIALGGNALLRRDEAQTADNQRRNVEVAARALAPVAARHELVVTHGNGPQVGLLALQGAAYEPDNLYPLDILDAETEGMIGYLIERELGNVLGPDRPIASLLTQVRVDAKDPAFAKPTKPIGPVYAQPVARKLADERHWSIVADGDGFRRVVASPRPLFIVELGVIRLLVEHGVVVVCAGGGGIPVVEKSDGSLVGVEAVIDKDHASALLARELGADALLMLTDVDALYDARVRPTRAPWSRASSATLRRMDFETGTMAPKVAAACDFVEATGGIAGIGRLADAGAILEGDAGTTVTRDADVTAWRN